MIIKLNQYHFTCQDIKFQRTLKIILFTCDTQILVTAYKKWMFLHYIRATFDHPTRYLA